MIVFHLTNSSHLFTAFQQKNNNMVFGTKSTHVNLDYLGLFNTGTQYWNLDSAELVEHTLTQKSGMLADSGALCVSTGEFTGRAPKDKFCVEDDVTRDTVWWGNINQPVAPKYFDQLLGKMQAHLQGQPLYIRDAYAGADPQYRIKVRAINTTPWANLFVHNMFIRPEVEELKTFEPEWTILAVPDFHAEGPDDGVRQHNFSIINFTKRMILIGGTGYTGEMKKGIFTVLNYLLPSQNVLPMHCSANIGEGGDTAVFFGLSGTGKTTLSADPQRHLIGDDEHGWTENGVFNFEGGCYAKCIDLSPEKEPQIWHAIRQSAILENTRFFPGTRQVNFADTSVTENTRVSYPIHHIDGIAEPSMGGIPKNIFFLTCDAFGVLPPISRLTPGQAMYQFISGYTAKVAGTEEGITEPVTAFSACYGAPFLPLHPTRYAEMLGEKIKSYGTNVWLVNTGWSGGPYGVGKRMKLDYTRAMISAALEGQLDAVEYQKDPIFGLSFPLSVPGVPSAVLDPKSTWEDHAAYDEKAMKLAAAFRAEFKKYEDFASEEILAAAPSTSLAQEH